MCSHYEALQLELFVTVINAEPPPPWPNLELDMRPRYRGAFVRARQPLAAAGDGASPARESAAGRWGLVPARMKVEGEADQLKLSTFNARDDRVAKAFTFSGAWKKGQHCIVPIAAFYEPDWRTGSSVSTRFTRADGKPMGIAGLWDEWPDPRTGETLASFTMLTIAAAEHDLLKNYHQPDKEKRMIVVLPEDRYGAWLAAPAADSMDFLLPYPAEQLRAEPRPSPPRAKTKAAAGPASGDLFKGQPAGARPKTKPGDRGL